MWSICVAHIYQINMNILDKYIQYNGFNSANPVKDTSASAFIFITSSWKY